jgi:RNA polymerase sigma-70 factor, ECF subfamily
MPDPAPTPHEAPAPVRPGAASPEEARLLASLRDGDEAAFSGLVARYHAPMVRFASAYVPSRAIAEEVVQETWLGVLDGLDRFEGRSSLKTWIFRILVHKALTRGTREHRTVPFSALFDPARDEGGPAVDPERFQRAGAAHPGHWSDPPKRWEGAPEDRLLSRETLGLVGKAIDSLSPNQREVIVLRDVEGWTSPEVCNVLGITETNQRVLLHRARSKVRQALETYLDEPV